MKSLESFFCSYSGELPPAFEWIDTDLQEPRLKITFPDRGPSGVAILEGKDDGTPGKKDAAVCIYSGTLKNESGSYKSVVF